jgi:hypothetical protein
MAITTNGKVSITNLQVGSSDDLAGIISDESGTGVLAFTTSPTFTTPALGTPSAVTLTNGTGLPVSGISASTSDAIGVGTIELGHATDTTLSRSSAGVLAVEGNAVYTSGGALGTPSSVTLTNGTGLPVSGITASTSDAIGVGSIELGHATDTTLARASSGVVTIEGVNVVTTSSTDTLTNKTLTSPVISGLTISDGSIIIEGATPDDFETTLQFTDPTADRTITFPDGGGTIAFSTAVDATVSTLAGLEIAVIMAAF